MKSLNRVKLSTVLAVALGIILTPTPAKNRRHRWRPIGAKPPPPIEFRIGIPGWIAGLSGDFGVRGVVSDQDVNFTDILKRLDMIAVGSLYARYKRWEIFADGQYLKISDTAQLPGLLFDRARISIKSLSLRALLVIGWSIAKS